MLRVASWVYFGLAAVSIIAFLNTELVLFIGGAISLATVGIVLLALDKLISLLTDIRYVLVNPAPAATGAADDGGDTAPARQITALASDIEKLKAKVGSA